MHHPTSRAGTLPATDVVRVVVADDSAVMREAVADVLGESAHLEVVAVLPDGTDLVATVQRTGAHVVLLDVVMEAGGAEAARALTRAAPDVAVVAVSANGDPSTVVELLRAGATGYFLKGRLGDDFPGDVLRCARGEVVVAVPHAASLLRGLVADG